MTARGETREDAAGDTRAVGARGETREAAGGDAGPSLRKAPRDLRADTLAAGGSSVAAPAGAPRPGRRPRNFIAPLLVVALLLGAWELLVRAGIVDELLLPAPTHVLQALWEDRGLLASDLLVTSYEVVAGLAAALVLGVALAVAMHLVPAVETALRPLVVGSQAVPIPVIAPIIVLIFGFGLAPKILIIALICFFPVTVSVADGLRDSDPDARKLLRSLGATKWQRLTLLDAPSALPAAFTGMKVAAAVAVIGAVLAEWSGSEAGLGHLLITANGQLETARAFAATVLLMAEAIALYALFAALERKVVSWAPRSRS